MFLANLSAKNYHIHRNLVQIAGGLRSAVNRNSGFMANKLMLGPDVNTFRQTSSTLPPDG